MTDDVLISFDKFLYGVPDSFTTPFVDYITDSSPLNSIAKSFQNNLKAAVKVGSIPFTLADAAVLQQRYHSVLAAESIRDLKTGEARPLGKAEDRAMEIMRAEAIDQARVTSHTKSMIAFVEAVTSNPDAAEATDELLRQVLVVIWGAFEVLVNDVVVETLNRMPQLAERLQKAQRYKVISIEKLATHNFNLSNKMGSVIFEDQRLDKIALIKEVCELLFEGAALSTSLNNQELWNLSQKRHLIVHRRGIVDSQYLSKTPYNVPLGSTLISTGAEVEMFLRVVRDVGLVLLRSANEILAFGS